MPIQLQLRREHLDTLSRLPAIIRFYPSSSNSLLSFSSICVCFLIDKLGSQTEDVYTLI